MKKKIFVLVLLAINVQAYCVPSIYEKLIYKEAMLSEEGEDYKDTVAELISNLGNIPEIKAKQIETYSNQIIDSIVKRGCKVNDRSVRAYQIDSNLIVLEIGKVNEREFLFKENICGVVIVIRLGKEIIELNRHDWRLYNSDRINFFNLIGITKKDSLLIIGEQTYVRPFYNIYKLNKNGLKFIKRITVEEMIK